MATIDVGKLTFVHKGDYSSSTAYVLNDVVYYNGSAYIAKQATTNNVPTNATYWNLFVLKGTDTSVLTTQGDVLYHNGSALARLGNGTAGQVLQTGGSGANPSWTDAPSGVIKKIHYYEHTTRYVPGNSVQNVFDWTTSFVPLDPVNNSMIVNMRVPSRESGHGNDYSGFGIRFSKSGGSDYDFQGRGTFYVAITSGSAGSTLSSQGFVIPAGTIPAGTYTLRFRLYTADSQATYMISTSDDSRVNVQTRGTLTIQEYKN
jgi:hypothetical protein